MPRTDARSGLNAFQLFMVSGLGAFIVVYPLWNDFLGVATIMKNSDLLLTVGLVCSAALVVLISYAAVLFLSPKVAVRIGAVCWILFGAAAMEQGFEIAKKIH